MGGEHEGPDGWRFFGVWYPKGMKVREVLKLLKDDGWYIVVTRDSHRQLKHDTKKGRVTVAGKPCDDIRPGTLNSILKQAGLKEE
jgi:predicted RNA binding protein YcfA (HicA-like mRNA interferase family)